ncbi:DNA polymerase III subunit gamma/tau [Caldicellulosiruptoraceae bacterium PP1]
MHLALYRKYRPQVFEDVVAQEHIVKTLKNQVKLNKISHAYIFFGPRGTGKTSTAKILSRAVNCLNPKDGNPCNQCENCKSILEEKTIDVVEIDAASNTGVDNVRQIRDEVRYPPSNCKKKVYIIDEVHMLSTGAFNALLKTLEEPPEHVIFILATTDIQKVPATILSRCQRFDFKRISTADIAKRLIFISKKENIDIDEDAINLISKKAEGGMRDALTILERCTMMEEGRITYQFVSNLLGISAKEATYDYFDAVINKNTVKALEIINKLYLEGYDLVSFVEDAVELLRNSLVIRLGASQEILDLMEDEKKKVQNFANLFETSRLVSMLKTFVDLSNQLKWSRYQKVQIELVTIRLIESRLDYTLEGLMERVRKLEKKLENQNLEITPEILQKLENQKKVSKKEEKSGIIDKKENEQKEENKNKISDLKTILDRWEEIKEAIKEEKPGIYEVLNEGIVKIKDALIIQFSEEFSLYTTLVENNKDYIKSVIMKLTNKECEIKADIYKEDGEIQQEKTQEDTIELLSKLFPGVDIEVKE